MTAEKLLSPTILRKLLRYEAETGKLYWRKRTPDVHPNQLSQWNGRLAGKEAFKIAHPEGYLSGGVYGRLYLAHRIIWAIVYGAWPAGQIDHINGNRADNRISNLRVVSNAENGKNQKRPADNASGVIGVYWNKRAKKWHARISVSGKVTSLGYFKNINDAASARKAAEAEYGYHPNHGRNAN